MTLSNNDPEFFNCLARDFNEPATEDPSPVPIPPDAAEQTLAPKIREEFAEIDSYSVQGTGLLRDRHAASLLIGLLRRQAG
jgi:hypothetical protein